MESRTSTHGRSLILVLGAIVGLAPLSIDMYLPALPSIAREFHAAGSTAQLTLAAYFIGLAVGQFVYGLLADRYGRKPPLYGGLALYAAASLGCAFAPGIAVLIALRFLQALGGCAGIVVPTAVVRDLFDQRDSARVLSQLMLVMGVAPMLAPLAGSQLLAHFGWRAVFVVLAAIGLLALLAIHRLLHESLPAERRKPIALATVRHTYGLLFADRHFLAYALAGACAGAAMFSYISGSPFVLIDDYGVAPATYSIIFGANACALIAASQLNHRLLARHHPDRVLAWALAAMGAAGAALLACALSGAFGVAGIVVPLFCFMATLGFITPNTAAGAMAGHGAHAGTASALLGTMRYGIATLAGVGVGIGGGMTAGAMAGAMCVCAAAAVLCYAALRRSAA
ncbi:MAG TPA: Bcr/CflA family multidrug efflux MFS transporter [Telluria sp.]|nr:Bcr/CflA family multidrug efflux MFS transporter [Telluria sp.]